MQNDPLPVSATPTVGVTINIVLFMLVADLDNIKLEKPFRWQLRAGVLRIALAKFSP
jgi:hypothetical protein